MSKPIVSLCITLTAVSLLAGCGGEEKKAVNEYYQSHQTTIPKTLFPKNDTGTAPAHKTEEKKTVHEHIASPTEAHHETVKNPVAKPVQTVEAAQTKAVQTKAVQTKAVQTKAVQTKTVQTKTVQTKTVQTKTVQKVTPHAVHTPETALKKPVKKAAPVKLAAKTQQPVPAHHEQIQQSSKSTIVYTMPKTPAPVKPVDAQAEIAKTLKAVEKIKAEAAKEIAESLKVIKVVKPIKATEVIPAVPSAVDVVKAKAVAEIAKATAFAESANAIAKAKIAKAVAAVKIAEIKEGHKPIDKETVEKEKKQSAAVIAKAVAAAEIAKAKSAAVIAKSVAEVEKEKAKKYPALSEKLFGKEQ